MFRVHNINTHDISIRNLILLFLTIVMWFASVITLWFVEIPSSIDNARQTIAKVTITEDGTDDAPLEMEISSWGIIINPLILDDAGNFSGRVLGIDDNGNVVYALSTSLVVSGVSGWGWGWDGLWTGILWADIYNINNGHVGIGNNTPTSGKLHITSTWETELYLEEANSWSSASIHLKNNLRVWSIGNQWLSDRFYIGEASGAIDFVITPVGFVGIGTIDPKANLQVVGNFIAGETWNTILGTNSSIGWWWNWPYPNRIIWDYWFIWWWTYQNISWQYGVIAGWSTNTIIWNRSSIGWWSSNTITGSRNTIAGGDQNKIDSVHSIIGWWFYNIINSISWSNNFIGGWNSNIINSILWSNNFIWWGDSNTISWATNYNIIGWGKQNEISSDSRNAFIGGGRKNSIVNSMYSVIPWGNFNIIEWWSNNFAAGYKSNIINHKNTFLRNSDSSEFSGERDWSFLINVPFEETLAGTQKGGVGINTDNPRTPLDVNGIIRTRAEILEPAKCNTDTEGSITFDGTHFYGCDSSNRKQLDN